jgi:hypothetical protein
MLCSYQQYRISIVYSMKLFEELEFLATNGKLLTSFAELQLGISGIEEHTLMRKKN